TSSSSPHSTCFQPFTLPSLGETISHVAPSSSRPSLGPVSSTCSNPSQTTNATLFPSSFLSAITSSSTRLRVLETIHGAHVLRRPRGAVRLRRGPRALAPSTREDADRAHPLAGGDAGVRGGSERGASR